MEIQKFLSNCSSQLGTFLKLCQGQPMSAQLPAATAADAIFLKLISQAVQSLLKTAEHNFQFDEI